MPDPVLYLKAMCAALGASAIITLALSCWRRADEPRLNVASLVGVSVGILLGYLVLGMRPVWPPMNALGRWWLIVLPSVAAIELIAASQRLPQWGHWLLRSALAMLAGRILLHDSAYLVGPNREWTALTAAIILNGCGLLLLAEWTLLIRLAQRSSGVSLAVSLACCIQCCGIAVMLAGYVSGGAAVIPVAAAITGVAIAAVAIRTPARLEGTIGIGTVSLFSLLVIGRFFGKLSTSSALAMMLAPQLCWIAELPGLRSRSRWVVVAVQLVLVAIPLLVVLTLAKLKFDREILPLL